ncbi:hypothetical protein Scep_013103 [Stephania cephalantha]|uniref:Cysteine-rich receptor-like protein kinase 10 n=1 Tax=Stephania cephalantha TaxID=152367 RepID=A0AAP0JIG3_9MAGN
MMMKYFYAFDLMFLLTFTCLVLLQSFSRAEELILESCSTTSNYTSSSQFKTNLNLLLLPSPVSNDSRVGFFNASSIGASPNTVYSLMQCRGDISMEDCSTCLNSAKVVIVSQCPGGKNAVLRFENCLLRYSDTNFFSQVLVSPMNPMPSANLATNSVVFNGQLVSLIRTLTTGAASNASRFQIGLINYTNTENIYGMAQCTGDLSEPDCLSCLQNMNTTVSNRCKDSEGCRAVCASCIVRYEKQPFFDLSLLSPIPPPPPPLPPSPPGPPTGNVVAIVVPTVVEIPVLLLAFCAYLKRRRSRMVSKKSWRRLNRWENIPGINGESIEPQESPQFALDTIRNATNDFADANKLGRGGFGVVYKGTLSNGQEIAVKRLSKTSVQGSEEFKNEVMLLHKLQHKNLVRLLGFCLDGEEKLLIYEYVPNGSLDKHLFDPAKKVFLDWEIRYKIISRIVRGLLYLHEDSRLKIIHRDLKAGNILLDDEMNAKISDFGMARLFGVDQTHQKTKRVAGTFGYMAPEYVINGIISMKSDVYSFGVLVLEIISGQQIINQNQADSSKDLIRSAWMHWKEGAHLEFLDPSLTSSSPSEVMKCMHIGLLCIQNNIEDRPTMASVALMLDSNSAILATPSPPPFVSESESHPSEWESVPNVGQA